MNDVSTLTNDELISHATAASAAERQATATVVRYLAEIESRRLHLALGFSSLFDFTTTRLGYSESSALRRIKAARVLLAEPAVAKKLETGELNFATIDVLSNFIKAPELKSLTQQLCGRSKEEAEKIVAHLRPMTKADVRDRVVPVVVAPRADASPSLPFESDENSNYLRANAQPEPRKCEEFGMRPEEQYKISFAMSAEEKATLDRAQLLMFAGDPSAVGLGTVIGKLAKFYLAHRCPRERQKRREKRAERAAGANSAGDKERAMRASGSPSKPQTAPVPPPDKPVRTQLPRAVRDRVLARDDYRCTFVAADGTRCSCEADLEIDHIVPVAHGGDNSEQNLRVLCRAHNLEQAFELIGEEYVRAKMRRRG